MLLLEEGEILLGFPVPNAVAREDQVHLLERSLVGLRVQRPDDDDAQRIDGTEDVQRLLVEALEDRREKQDTPAVAWVFMIRTRCALEE